MTTRDLLRTAVLRTNPCVPFRWTNRWPYYAALKAATSALSASSEVSGLWLRHGLASRKWIPGLSDIDFCLTMKRGLTPEHEFLVIDQLRARYRSLGKWFPMLGDLEILGEDDLPLWLRTIGETISSWTLLHGQVVEDDPAHASASREPALRTALCMYLDYLPPCLAQPDSWLRRNDVRRRIEKILRLLKPIIAGARPAIDEQADTPLLVACAARALELGIAAMEASPPCREPAHVALPLEDRVLLILADGLSSEKIAGAIRARTGNCPVLPMPQTVFRYFVRRYDPYWFTSLMRRGEISGVPAPEIDDFAAYWRARFETLLLFARSTALFPEISLPEFENEVRRAMTIRLWLEKDRIVTDRGQINPDWRREYPELARIFDEICSAATTGHQGARSRAFAFFRSLANDARDAMLAVKT